VGKARNFLLLLLLAALTIRVAWLVPGSTAMPADADDPPHHWTAAVELGQTNPRRSLGTVNPTVETLVPPSVRADFAVSLDFPQQSRSSRYFLEIDLGTERPARITEKVAGYWRAVEANTADWFPYVVFIRLVFEPRTDGGPDVKNGVAFRYPDNVQAYTCSNCLQSFPTSLSIEEWADRESVGNAWQAALNHLTPKGVM
jgi:hypothetical protein